MGFNMQDDRRGFRPRPHRDQEVAAQIVRKGRIREYDNTTEGAFESITFSLDVAEIDPRTNRLVFIVMVPPDGQESDKVYIKQVRRRPQQRSQQRREDDDDRR